MNWKIFCEINGDLWSLEKDSRQATVWKLAGAIAALFGLIAAYWGLLNSIVGQLFSSLLPAIKDKFPLADDEALYKSWLHQSHFGLRLAVALLAFACVYLVAFALTALKRLDYRYQLAQALGMKFLRVCREHDVLDLSGACRTTSTESLTVFDLNLSYIERRLQVTEATPRSNPSIRVEGLPSNTQLTSTSRDEGKVRIYGVNFVPPLRHTLNPVKVTISERIDKAIYMYLQDTPDHPVLKQRVECISLIVAEPIDLLELSVTFPHGYVVGGASQVCVRYLRTSTIHDAEEQRLKLLTSAATTVMNNRQTLCLSVPNPIIGLQYYLCWEPPSRP